MPGQDPFSDEPEIICLAQQGDNQAFAVLVERYTPRIYSLFRRLLGKRRSLAEDMTQEVFLRAWRGLSSFTSGAKFFTWLKRIAINYWIQEHRRQTASKRSGTTFSIDAPIKDSDLYLEPPSRQVGPDHAAISHELGRAIHEAIDSLAEEMRAVVVLRDLEDHSYEEIAAMLDIPIGTVRSRLHRARSRLQEQLREFL